MKITFVSALMLLCRQLIDDIVYFDLSQAFIVIVLMTSYLFRIKCKDWSKRKLKRINPLFVNKEMKIYSKDMSSVPI